MKELRLSPSKQMDFTGVCERQFFHKHVEKLPQPESEALVVGNVYHMVIASLLRAGTITALEPAVTAAMEKYAEALKPFFTDRQSDFLWKEVYENCQRLHGEVLCWLQPTLIEGYHNDRVNNEGLIVDCRSEVSIVLNEYGVVSGTEPVPAVYDWKVKTSLRHRRTDDDARWSEQLSKYALLTGVTRAAFVEIPRSIDARIIITQANYTPEDLRRWKLYHDDMRLAIRSRGPNKEAYKRTQRSNPLCCASFCPFWDKCYGAEAPAA